MQWTEDWQNQLREMMHLTKFDDLRDFVLVMSSVLCQIKEIIKICEYLQHPGQYDQKRREQKQSAYSSLSLTLQSFVALVNSLENIFFCLSESNPIPLQFIHNGLEVLYFLLQNFEIENMQNSINAIDMQHPRTNRPPH